MISMTAEKMRQILEAALMVAGHPLTIAQLQKLFPEEEKPSAADLLPAIEAIRARYQDSGIELQEVASGYRFQARADLSPWLSRLWEERAPRYSRAFLETLAIIAYKQPITRAEIEEIRGVTVSSHIMKTLQDREWIRILGYRDLPGKPAILGTTKAFLDHFNLKSLTDLPPLTTFKTLEAQEAQIQIQLALDEAQPEPVNSDLIPEESEALVIEDFDASDTVVPLHPEQEEEDEDDTRLLA
ncbi:MAG TPA: SMC-Scp complex subunit ScpB [Gammaproteobacteria bacterium]|jgi:segregation and condensation protein B|nr:SMC-Scp complex subunit ScpB [Gammaproteobacteria bacterium]